MSNATFIILALFFTGLVFFSEVQIVGILGLYLTIILVHLYSKKEI